MPYENYDPEEMARIEAKLRRIMQLDAALSGEETQPETRGRIPPLGLDVPEGGATPSFPEDFPPTPEARRAAIPGAVAESLGQASEFTPVGPAIRAGQGVIEGDPRKAAGGAADLLMYGVPFVGAGIRALRQAGRAKEGIRNLEHSREALRHADEAPAGLEAKALAQRAQEKARAADKIFNAPPNTGLKGDAAISGVAGAGLMAAPDVLSGDVGWDTLGHAATGAVLGPLGALAGRSALRPQLPVEQTGRRSMFDNGPEFTATSPLRMEEEGKAIFAKTDRDLARLADHELERLLRAQRAKIQAEEQSRKRLSADPLEESLEVAPPIVQKRLEPPKDQTSAGRGKTSASRSKSASQSSKPAADYSTEHEDIAYTYVNELLRHKSGVRNKLLGKKENLQPSTVARDLRKKFAEEGLPPVDNKILLEKARETLRRERELKFRKKHKSTNPDHRDDVMAKITGHKETLAVPIAAGAGVAATSGDAKALDWPKKPMTRDEINAFLKSKGMKRVGERRGRLSPALKGFNPREPGDAKAAMKFVEKQRANGKTEEQIKKAWIRNRSRREDMKKWAADHRNPITGQFEAQSD